MTHDELRDSYELYLWGVAGAEERDEIRDHLHRGCEVCMAELKRAKQMSALLGQTAGLATPSPKLRRRILASVGFEQKRFGWAPFLAAALLLSLFAAFYFSGRERDFATLATRLDSRLREQTIQLTRMNEAFAILNGVDTTVTSFGKGQTQPPKGKVFVNPTQGVLLIASNLPQAPSGKTYRCGSCLRVARRRCRREPSSPMPAAMPCTSSVVPWTSAVRQLSPSLWRMKAAPPRPPCPS